MQVSELEYYMSSQARELLQTNTRFSLCNLDCPLNNGAFDEDTRLEGLPIWFLICRPFKTVDIGHENHGRGRNPSL